MQLNNVPVIDVRSNPGKGRFASRTFYTVTLLSGTNGEVRVDWNDPQIPANGDVVSCEVADTATYGKHRLIRVYGGGASHGTSSVGSTRSSAFPIPQDSKEQSIVRQSALKAAVDLVLRFPESYLGTTVSSAADCTADHITKRVIELAFTLSEFSSGALELDVASRLADKLKT